MSNSPLDTSGAAGHWITFKTDRNDKRWVIGMYNRQPGVSNEIQLDNGDFAKLKTERDAGNAKHFLDLNDKLVTATGADLIAGQKSDALAAKLRAVDAATARNYEPFEIEPGVVISMSPNAQTNMIFRALGVQGGEITFPHPIPTVGGDEHVIQDRDAFNRLRGKYAAQILKINLGGLAHKQRVLAEFANPDSTPDDITNKV
tara:strand:- start:260 stop:865 length:606 start_codon:yes stop_codon:yes gene_type:complete